MEDWSRTDFFNLELFVLGIYSFVCLLLGLKIAISPAATLKHQQRYAFYVWVLGVLCIGTVFGVWMVVRPPFPTQATSNTVQPSPSPSPCLTVAASNPTPPQVSQRAPATTLPREVVSSGDANFVIDSISLAGSHFPVQGRFPVKYQVEPNGAVRLTISNPVFRVAGRSSVMGTRRITYVRAGINTYAELDKIFYGQRGTAEWSDWVKVALEVPAGPELPAGRPIELVIPRKTAAALSNKGLIMQMKSVLSSSGEEQYPSCALSNGNVFSGH